MVSRPLHTVGTFTFTRCNFTLSNPSIDQLFTTTDNSGTRPELRIEEVRKVLREGYPVGRDYNVRVRLADHQSILGITSWGLTTVSDMGDGAEQIHYSSKALSIDQTEIDFEANLTSVYGAFVFAINATEYKLAIGFGILNKTGGLKMVPGITLGNEYIIISTMVSSFVR